MTKFFIPEMSCGHCKATVKTTVRALDPTAAFDFDMPARTVTIESAAKIDAMQAALSRAGYEATAA